MDNSLIWSFCFYLSASVRFRLTVRPPSSSFSFCPSVRRCPSVVPCVVVRAPSLSVRLSAHPCFLASSPNHCDPLSQSRLLVGPSRAVRVTRLDIASCEMMVSPSHHCVRKTFPPTLGVSARWLYLDKRLAIPPPPGHLTYEPGCIYNCISVSILFDLFYISHIYLYI